VEGNLYASEWVAIPNSAQVKGNVISPRVNLEDGARFKGSIEMDSEAVESALGISRAKGNTASASTGGRNASPDPKARPGETASASSTASGKSNGANDYSKLNTAEAAR
jgi:hypothetical protein